eukprot:gene451-234_t
MFVYYNRIYSLQCPHLIIGLFIYLFIYYSFGFYSIIELNTNNSFFFFFHLELKNTKFNDKIALNKIMCRRLEIQKGAIFSEYYLSINQLMLNFELFVELGKIPAPYFFCSNLYERDDMILDFLEPC